MKKKTYVKQLKNSDVLDDWEKKKEPVQESSKYVYISI